MREMRAIVDGAKVAQRMFCRLRIGCKTLMAPNNHRLGAFVERQSQLCLEVVLNIRANTVLALSEPKLGTREIGCSGTNSQTLLNC